MKKIRKASIVKLAVTFCLVTVLSGVTPIYAGLVLQAGTYDGFSAEVMASDSQVKGCVDDLPTTAELDNRLAGWVLSEKPVDQIIAVINGEETVITERHSRDDLQSVFPGYDTAAAGYSIDISYASGVRCGINSCKVQVLSDGVCTDIFNGNFETSVKKGIITENSLMGCVDKMPSTTPLNDILKGWVLSGNTVEKIVVEINGQENTASRHSRDDLQVVFPGYGTAAAGYLLNLNTADGVKKGTNSCIVRVLSNGVWTEIFHGSFETSIKKGLVSENSLIGCVDKVPSATPEHDALEGWVLSGNTVEKIVVEINGQENTASRHSRDDLQVVFPGYGTAAAGFSLDLNKADGVINGTNNCIVRALSGGIWTVIFQARFESSIKKGIINQNNVIGCVDEIPSLLPQNDIIEGWVLSKDLVDKVVVVINGHENTASRHSRDDLQTVFPGYGTASAGFSLDLNRANGVIKGKNKCTVRVLAGGVWTEIFQAGFETTIKNGLIEENSLMGCVDKIPLPSSWDDSLEGWVLSKNKVDQIVVIVNGRENIVGRHSRDDLQAVYPGYETGTAGYSIHMYTAAGVKSGMNRCTVKVLSNGIWTEIFNGTIEIYV